MRMPEPHEGVDVQMKLKSNGNWVKCLFSEKKLLLFDLVSLLSVNQGWLSDLFLKVVFIIYCNAIL